MHPLDPGRQRGQGVDDVKAPIAMAMPVQADV